MQWCEIGLKERTADQKIHFNKLNAELRALGIEGGWEFLTCTLETLEATVEDAKSRFDGIRFAEDAGTSVLKKLTQVPAGIAILGAADALVKEGELWWPRCFLVESLNQTLSASVLNIDLTGSVFISGACGRARAVIAALAKIGFGRIIVSDADDSRSVALVEELKRAYFGIQFQHTPRNLVTQLPGICSIAVNTLEAGEDVTSASELAYFNFLKTGGIWLDLALFPLNRILQAEAVSVGGELLNGYEVIARADLLWLEAVFSTKGMPLPPLDLSAYIHNLAQT